MATTKKRTTTATCLIVAKPVTRAKARSASNGAGPYLGLSDAARKRQQQRLRKLRAELIAEGAKPGKHIDELRRRAATWPE
jgi:hypothetical protein